MADERLFVDTWGWLVLANVRDPSFAAVAERRRNDVERGRMWVTSDYVLDETITRLFSAAPFDVAKKFCNGLFESQQLGLLAIETVTRGRFHSAYKLRLRYHDKPRVSFTDLTSFTLMHELGIRHVLTADAHFAQAGLGFHRVP
ncbi:MAG TPA: hypothetical protein VJN43_01125 [Bryobacteraceae bacterium]|nr:hypothetical protein [Bryobacteraceae bacterium]